MSKYNIYARRLDEAFKKARKRYADAYDNMTKAKEKYDASKKFRIEKRIGENEIVRAKAELAYSEAKAEFDEVKKNAWPEFERTVSHLTKELDEDIKKDSLSHSDAIDDDALKLMESGVMTTDDYLEMAKQFDGNSTMLKFVGKNAKEAINKAEDATDKAKLRQVIEATEAGSKTRRDWDSLTECAEMYNGQSRSKSDPGFVCKMAEHWDGVQKAIESF